MPSFLSYFGIPTYKFFLYNLLYFLSDYLSSIPSQTFTVYKNIAISLLAMFFVKLVSLFGHNSTFYQVGDSFI